jgi:hypothetical protein
MNAIRIRVWAYVSVCMNTDVYMCRIFLTSIYFYALQPLLEDKKTDSNGNGVSNHELTSDYSSEYSKTYSNCYSNGVNNGYMATAATKSNSNNNSNISYRTSTLCEKK